MVNYIYERRDRERSSQETDETKLRAAEGAEDKEEIRNDGGGPDQAAGLLLQDLHLRRQQRGTSVQGPSESVSSPHRRGNQTGPGERSGLAENGAGENYHNS